MKQYYYEITEDNRLLGKTGTFSIQDMDSTPVTDELRYYASKSKCSNHTTFSLREVQTDGSKSSFSGSPQIFGKD